MVVVAAESVEMDSRGLRVVEDLFNSQIENGVHPGACVAAYRHGKLVLDLYGGVADRETGRPVTEDTLFVMYSCSKALAATCMHILWERGKLDWDDRVARYWPGFAKNGKESCTIRHIMIHRGGFPASPRDLHWDRWRDWDAVVGAIENAEAIYEPGAVQAYHPLNYGWVVGELVRRIDGRPYSQFLREEVTDPLGMSDTYVGLPPSLEGRVSKIHAMEDADAAARGRLENIQDIVHIFNQPEVQQAVVPAANGIATARDLARYYAMLVGGGELDGVRILKPETIAEATRLHAEGLDRTTTGYVRLGLGVALADPRVGYSKTASLRTFGHGGAGTSIAWGDPDAGLGVAIIANGYHPDSTNNPRLATISQSIRNACL